MRFNHRFDDGDDVFDIFPMKIPEPLCPEARRQIADVAERWCEEQFGTEAQGGYVRVSGWRFRFSCPDTALQFKLRWC